MHTRVYRVGNIPSDIHDTVKKRIVREGENKKLTNNATQTLSHAYITTK